MLDFNELLQKMRNNEIPTTSTYNMRNVDLQVKKKKQRFNNLKKELGKKSRLLLIRELSIPRNPFTMEESDLYNRAMMFRTERSLSSTIGALKIFYNENPKMKQKLLNYLGIDEWNTSEVNRVSVDDRRVLDRFIDSRIFTLPAVNVKLPGLCRNVYGTNYRLDVERDEIGSYKGYYDADSEFHENEYPVALQINKMFSEIANININNWLENEGGKNKTEEDQKDQKRLFYSKNPVSSDRPNNYYLMIELPRDEKGKLKDGLSSYTKEDILKSIVVTNKADKIDLVLDNYTEERDLYVDFIEMDMNCPVKIRDDETVGKKTAFEKVDWALADQPGYEEFVEKVTEVLDDLEEFGLENLVRGSVYVLPITEDIENKMLQSVSKAYPLKTVPTDKDFIESNKDILSLIYGDEFDDILDKYEDGELNSTGHLNKDEASKESRSFTAIDVTEITDDLDIPVE